MILAAGASTRLGTCKALVDLGGRTPLERLAAEGPYFDGAPPLVVAGAHAAEIARAAPRGVEVLANEAWAEGRLGGIALAARARRGLDLCLAPVDVPLVPTAVFEALARAWIDHGAPPRGWLAPRFGRAHGHPIVIGRELAERADERARSGGKDLPLRALRELADPLLSVAVDAIEVLDDLDTPDDLDRLRRRIS